MAKVLVASSEGQGDVEGDYSWRVDGELVYVQGLACSNPACGCDRGFAGMSSSRATTTAQVVDRPDLSDDEVRQALADSLDRGGWIDQNDGSAETAAFIADLYASLVEIIDGGQVGSLVRRRGDWIFYDRPAAAA